MNNNHDRAALLIAMAAVLNARIAGMVAENDFRKQKGETVAYDEMAFETEIVNSGCSEADARNLLGW